MKTTPIRWSARRVSEAMDQVEQQLDLADAYLAEAEAKALEATRIQNLPGYMFGRIARLHQVIKDGRERMRTALRGVRKDIPEGALRAERPQGMQQELTL